MIESRTVTCEQVTSDQSLPDLAYICDFPPANQGGGDTLLLRLLRHYPPGQLSIFTSSRAEAPLRSSPFSICRTHLVREFAPARRDGWRQLLVLIDRALLPLHVIWIAWNLQRWRAKAILSVTHGYLFIAACIVSRLRALPLILIVHDDWVAMQVGIIGFRHISSALFRWCLHAASVVYAVSEPMQHHLLTTYGVHSRLQLPATEVQPCSPVEEISVTTGGSPSPFVIVFAGMIYQTVWNSIDCLVRVLKGRQLNGDGRRIELHIYSPISQSQLDTYGWTAPDVIAKGWVGQTEIPSILRAADLLFLPVSFTDAASHYAATSFPSKVADYLASGTPMFVVAPAMSSVAIYVRKHGCAALVQSDAAEAIGDGLRHVIDNAAYRRNLTQSAYKLVRENHDIRKQRLDFESALHSVTTSQTI